LQSETGLLYLAVVLDAISRGGGGWKYRQIVAGKTGNPKSRVKIAE
jgi:hypothetical protein